MTGLPSAPLLLLAAAVLTVTPATAATLSESTSLATLVSDVVARATSTSEVLTLNLTNLIILIVIKAIVIVFGMFAFGGGFGSLFGGGFGRSADASPSDSWLDREDLLLMLTYLLSSDGSDNYECLNRVACEQPDRAAQYINAGKLLLGGAKMADKIITVSPEKYTNVLHGMQKAVYHGQSGGVCSLRYKCSRH
ncbi:uncharacterized protein LOC122394361 [Amphibalanus amphitrite]|uniref:uncharacterized protein LOC122394361 n=2 Tax=Amphibalanus amphitrite TaxID=1232801 RepID=UPI001C907A7B|nr:uncharacterized protein LOC122394361 [Amphibalanus amphitrite]